MSKTDEIPALVGEGRRATNKYQFSANSQTRDVGASDQVANWTVREVLSE